MSVNARVRPLLPKGRATRQRILDCAIEAVAEIGYTNTTTQIILDRSGLSRGSLLHQFSTRTDLMVTVAETAMAKMLSSIGSRMSVAGDDLDGLYRYPQIFWETLIEPPALAFYELQMASRWDLDLQAGLKDQIARVETYIAETIGAIARRYQMTDLDGYIVHLGIITDALPSLAARRALTSDPGRIDAERAVLEQWHHEGLSRRLPSRHRRSLD